MSHVACVYRGVGGEAPFDKHPCVVVLEIEGSDECLVIPAFTAGRAQIEALVEFHRRGGVDEFALAVTMDNREAIAWHQKYEAVSHAVWATVQVDKLDRDIFRSQRPVGTMKPEYLLKLYRSLLAFIESQPGRGRFSAPLVKKVRQAIKRLEKQ